jgi:dynein heavy chain
VIFVDDLNMPKKEEFFAQPPIEVIRQWMDHSGWFDRKNLVKINIVDVVFLSAMGPPGGGRTFITNRLVRHFNMVTYTGLEDSDTQLIFTTKLNAFLATYTLEVTNAIEKATLATLNLYKNVEQEMLPTP